MARAFLRRSSVILDEATGSIDFEDMLFLDTDRFVEGNELFGLDDKVTSTSLPNYVFAWSRSITLLMVPSLSKERRASTSLDTRPGIMARISFSEFDELNEGCGGVKGAAKKERVSILTEWSKAAFKVCTPGTDMVTARRVEAATVHTSTSGSIMRECDCCNGFTHWRGAKGHLPPSSRPPIHLQKAGNMAADLNPLGRHSDRWLTSSPNENALSITAREPDPSNESEHLVLVYPVKTVLIMCLSQHFSTAILGITPKLGEIVPFAIGAMVSMPSSSPSTSCLSGCCSPTRSIRFRSQSTTRTRQLPWRYFFMYFTWYVCETFLGG